MTTTPDQELFTGKVAVVATNSPGVYSESMDALRHIGFSRIHHLPLHKIVDTGTGVFWVIDGRLPNARAVITMLLTTGHTNGLVLSSMWARTFNTWCVANRIPALLMHRQIEPESTRNPLHLTPREISILQDAADGLSYKETAEKQGLSALTVKSHLQRVAKRAKTGDRAELVIIAMRQGLVQ